MTAVLLALAALAADPKPEGSWKLTLIRPLQEVEFLAMDVSRDGANYAAKVNDWQKVFPTEPTVEGFSADGDTIRFTVGLQGARNPFRGTLDPSGVVLGTLRIQGKALPARLERASSGAGVQAMPIEVKLIRSYYDARADKDAAARYDKLAAFFPQVGENPRAELIFLDLLSAASAAGKDEAEARGLAARWQAIARPYGPDYLFEARSGAVKALDGQAPLAALALEIARDAERDLPPDASHEARASAARLVASAARQAGKGDDAAQAETRAKAEDDRAKAEAAK